MRARKRATRALTLGLLAQILAGASSKTSRVGSLRSHARLRPYDFTPGEYLYEPCDGDVRRDTGPVVEELQERGVLYSYRSRSGRRPRMVHVLGVSHLSNQVRPRLLTPL